MKLIAQRADGGVAFRVEGPAGVVPPAEWAAEGEPPRLPSGEQARIGVLLRLLEDGDAEPRDENIVFASHSTVAGLDEAERRLIGLPGSAGLTLELRGTGGFHDPDFRIERRLVHLNGQPVVAPQVEGCFLRIGDEVIVLPEPLFSLWEGVERFNEESGDTEARLIAWARLKELLPEDVRIDDTLQSVQVALASAFTLKPFRNERGEPDFDPVLGRWIELSEGEGQKARGFEDALAQAQHREFARRFRGRREVQHRYLGGDGVYIVLSDRLKRALKVARDVQDEDAGTRRRFLTRPSMFLRNALEADIEAQGAPAEDTLVDDVFFDEGLSDRVKGIGVWEAKVLPWLKPSGEQWLPEDPAGILIDNQPVPVPPEKAPELLDEVRRARAEGRDSVEFEGTQIPATEQTERALETLVEATRGRQVPSEPEPPKPETDRGPRLALLIIDNLEQLGFRMKPRGSRGSAERTPTALVTPLLRHQVEGLRWVQKHWISGSPGALLADDMGLGKTLQALAFLAWVREEMASRAWPRRPILVVAPTGLIRNWRAEHDKHLDGDGLGQLLEAVGPGLRALRAARDAEGRELATGLPSLDIAGLDRRDWVMTTYETLRDYQHSFGRVHWAVVVFDEAQKIKNPAAGLTDAAKAMKQDFTLVMTGTPVENRIEDLWSILDAARPGGLGALKEFSSRFSNGDPARTNAELTALRAGLTEGAPPAIMLRRLKEDHLDGLPVKEVHTHRRPMPDRQANAYREAILAARRGAPMLQVLQQLRSISLHPSPSDAVADDDFINDSARLAVTFDLLDDIRARGEKALVFLESRAVQDALAEILQRRYRLRDRVLIINGEVTGASRKARVDEFERRHGFDVMILSPRAGGVGLTLTAANHVIHLARWWNPAVEDQCTDRVYRIGQGKPVQVHNVLAVHPELEEHSFDIRLSALLERKRQLNRSVLAPAMATASDLEELYRSTVENIK